MPYWFTQFIFQIFYELFKKKKKKEKQKEGKNVQLAVDIQGAFNPQM